MRDGQFDFTVTRVMRGLAKVGDASVSRQAQGQFVLIYLTAHNVGTVSQAFEANLQTGLDAQGNTYSPDLEAASYFQEFRAYSKAINPGNTVETIVIFDVPKGVQLSLVQLHDTPSSAGVQVRLTP